MPVLYAAVGEGLAPPESDLGFLYAFQSVLIPPSGRSKPLPYGVAFRGTQPRRGEHRSSANPIQPTFHMDAKRSDPELGFLHFFQKVLHLPSGRSKPLPYGGSSIGGRASDARPYGRRE